MTALRFTIADVQQANDAWGMNCGPAAVCAVLDLTPDELRPHLGDFEAKRYTSPSMMADILHRLGISFRRLYGSQEKVAGRPLSGEFPRLGLVPRAMGAGLGPLLACRFRRGIARRIGSACGAMLRRGKCST